MILSVRFHVVLRRVCNVSYIVANVGSGCNVLHIVATVATVATCRTSLQLVPMILSVRIALRRFALQRFGLRRNLLFFGAVREPTSLGSPRRCTSRYAWYTWLRQLQ